MENLLPLKFVVVGGSVAGLSAAYTLAVAGHQVVVLEAATEVSPRATLRDSWKTDS